MALQSTFSNFLTALQCAPTNYETTARESGVVSSGGPDSEPCVVLGRHLVTGLC